MSPDICPICLRTDRKLKTVEHKLFEFHDELCDFYLMDQDPRYCLECGYLLNKMYNFKHKCVTAHKILNKWANTKATRRGPIEELHTILPPSTLGVRHQNNTKVFTFNYQKNLEDNVLPRNAEDNKTDNEALLNIIDNDANVVDGGMGEDSVIFEDLWVDNEKKSNKSIKIETIEDVNTNHKLLELEDSTSFDVVLLKHNEDNAIDILRDDCEQIDNIENVVDNDIINISDNDFVNEKDNNDDDDNDEPLKTLSKKKVHVNKKTKRINNEWIKQVLSTKREDIGDSKNIKKSTKESFNKEMLKAELSAKFKKFGQLKTVDGELIDSEFIINRVDDVNEYQLKLLWNAVSGKKIIKPTTLRLFQRIQNKYKNVRNYDSVFDIEYLNTKEKMLEEFERRKTYACYVNAKFKCDICYQGFKYERRLEYHRKCHDVKPGDFVCSICGMKQNNKKILLNHYKANHEAVYKCKLCPLVTYYKLSMINHHNWHKGVTFRCEPCNLTFKSASCHCNHMSNRHNRSHVCTTCGKAFSLMGLKCHITREHEGEVPTESARQLRCLQCPLTFVTQDAVRRHVRISHETVHRGRPTGMSQDYKIRARRTVPNKRHKIAKFISCRVCHAEGKTYGWLISHFKTEHPDLDMNAIYADTKTHLCEVCGLGFKTVYLYRDHMNKHTGTRPYACPTCSKRFHAMPALRNHMLLHEPKSMECTFCGKMFRSPSNLSNHIRIHVRDRKYKCNICTKRFIHSTSLKEHVMGVHNNIRRVKKRRTESKDSIEDKEGRKRPRSSVD